jgi:glycosyltransferase involved in cell wall biosynthesis
VKPLSVLEICLSRSWGGIEMYSVLVAGWLQERGHRVSVLTLTGSPITKACQDRGFQVVEVAWGGHFSPLTGRALAKWIGQFRPNVLHAHLSRDLWSIALALWFSKPVPVVFSQQMSSNYPKRDPLHRLVWKRVSWVVASTEEIGNQVIRNTGMSPDRVQVLPHGIDSDRLKPSPQLREKLRRKYGISAQQFAIGVVGRLDPKKGQDVFLESLSFLKSPNPVLGVLIGEETRGEPGYRRVLEDLVQSLNLQNKIRFLGFIEDQLELYPMLDLLLLPSRKETFGMVLIEAMAFELPVIASNTGGVPEIVMDGETGILVPPGDSQAMAAAIEKIISERELLREMGCKGRVRAIERFQLKDHIDRLEALLMETVDENNESR